jgi:uncharacterized protein (TIGR02284 family)
VGGTKGVTMLRDARQVAIDQVVEALLEAAHLHEQGTDALDADPDLAGALRALAERRRRAAQELGEHLRSLGDLPSEPDADLQAAKDVLAWVQDALADDQRDQVLERSRQAEEHLAEKVRAALEEDVPSDTRALLEQLPGVPELRAALGSG